MNLNKALGYCSMYVDKHTDQKTLGFIHASNGYAQASNKVSIIWCKLDKPTEDVWPVARKYELEDVKPVDWWKSFPDPRGKEMVSINLSCLDGLKKSFNAWINAFSIVKKNFKTDCAILKCSENGLDLFASGNVYPTQGLFYRLCECAGPDAEFWYNPDFWIKACKVLADLNPQAIEIYIAEKGMVDIFAGDVRIKFCPIIKGEEHNPEAYKFYRRHVH